MLFYLCLVYKQLMARKTKQVSLPTSEGNVDFTLQQMDGVTAGLYSTVIIGMIAPAATAAFAEKNQRNMKDLGDAIRSACMQLSQGELQTMIDKLFTGARARVKNVNIDVDKSFIEEFFAGYSDSLFKLLWAAIELNYAGFLKPLQEGAQKLMQRVTVPPATPTSSGQESA